MYKKLNKIEEYLEELEEFLKFTDKEIFDDSMKMHIGERLFQLIIDEILDINQHFIGELDLKLTEDEIKVLASGLMEVTILDKKRTIVGDGFNFWVKIPGLNKSPIRIPQRAALST